MMLSLQSLVTQSHGSAADSQTRRMHDRQQGCSTHLGLSVSVGVLQAFDVGFLFLPLCTLPLCLLVDVVQLPQVVLHLQVVLRRDRPQVRSAPADACMHVCGVCERTARSTAPPGEHSASTGK